MLCLFIEKDGSVKLNCDTMIFINELNEQYKECVGSAIPMKIAVRR